MSACFCGSYPWVIPCSSAVSCPQPAGKYLHVLLQHLLLPLSGCLLGLFSQFFLNFLLPGPISPEAPTVLLTGRAVPCWEGYCITSQGQPQPLFTETLLRTLRRDGHQWALMLIRTCCCPLHVPPHPWGESRCRQVLTRHCCRASAASRAALPCQCQDMSSRCVLSSAFTPHAE